MTLTLVIRLDVSMVGLVYWMLRRAKRFPGMSRAVRESLLSRPLRACADVLARGAYCIVCSVPFVPS